MTHIDVCLCLCWCECIFQSDTQACFTLLVVSGLRVAVFKIFASHSFNKDMGSTLFIKIHSQVDISLGMAIGARERDQNSFSNLTAVSLLSLKETGQCCRIVKADQHSALLDREERLMEKLGLKGVL